jgi:hypothetical protein
MDAVVTVGPDHQGLAAPSGHGPCPRGQIGRVELSERANVVDLHLTGLLAQFAPSSGESAACRSGICRAGGEPGPSVDAVETPSLIESVRLSPRTPHTSDGPAWTTSPRAEGNRRARAAAKSARRARNRPRRPQERRATAAASRSVTPTQRRARVLHRTRYLTRQLAVRGWPGASLPAPPRPGTNPTAHGQRSPRIGLGRCAVATRCVPQTPSTWVVMIHTLWPLGTERPRA